MTQVFIGKIGPNGLFDADTEQEAMSLLPLNFDYNTLNIRPAPAPAPELAQPELAQPALAPELAQPALAPIPIQSDPITAGDGDRKMENPINAASVDQQRLNDLQKKALTERLQQLYSGRAQLLLPNADTPSVKEVVTSPEPTNEFKNLLFPLNIKDEADKTSNDPSTRLTSDAARSLQNTLQSQKDLATAAAKSGAERQAAREAEKERAQLLLPNADTPSVKEVVTSPEETEHVLPISWLPLNIKDEAEIEARDDHQVKLDERVAEGKITRKLEAEADAARAATREAAALRMQTVQRGRSGRALAAARKNPLTSHLWEKPGLFAGGGGKNNKTKRSRKSIRKPKRSRKSIRKPKRSRKSIIKPRKTNRKRVKTHRKKR